jgi:GMP synthase-like glutamine amidotransferase
VFACQFHPERSGPAGLEMYRNFVDILRAGGRRALPAGRV